MRAKLRDSRGETLVEALASILIAALSVALLFGGIAASSRLNVDARRTDGEYYKALSAAEGQSGLPNAQEGIIKIRIVNKSNGAGTELEAGLYGGKGMFSYEVAPAGEEGGGP